MRSPRLGLVVFDLDGTLLRGPTVCELLAAPLGRVPEMQAFERLTTESEIAEGRAQMAAWYRGIPRARLLRSLEGACWAPGVREGVSELKAAGLEVAIASITWEFAVEWFARELGVARFLGTGLSRSGRVRHVWGRDKAIWLQELAREVEVPRKRTAAVGDSESDRALLRAAGLRFYVGARPPPRLRSVAHYPAGDIAEVAGAILRQWREGPPAAMVPR